MVWFMGFDDAADGPFGVYFCHVVRLSDRGGRLSVYILQKGEF